MEEWKVAALVLSAALIGASGCSQPAPLRGGQVAEQTAPSENPNSEPPASASGIALPLEQPKPSDADEATIDSGDPPAASTSKTFKPPFAGREELFLPPTNAPAETAPPRSRSGVVLKGFVNVDGLRALVLVDGQLRSLAAGESRDGLEVVALEPPSVTLRREGRQWSDSLLGEKRSEDGSEPPPVQAVTETDAAGET